jgi:hypothetical protein
MEGQFDMLIPVYFIKVLADSATTKISASQLSNSQAAANA